MIEIDYSTARAIEGLMREVAEDAGARQQLRDRAKALAADLVEAIAAYADDDDEYDALTAEQVEAREQEARRWLRHQLGLAADDARNEQRRNTYLDSANCLLSTQLAEDCAAALTLYVDRYYTVADVVFDWALEEGQRFFGEALNQ